MSIPFVCFSFLFVDFVGITALEASIFPYTGNAKIGSDNTGKDMVALGKDIESDYKEEMLES